MIREHLTLNYCKECKVALSDGIVNNRLCTLGCKWDNKFIRPVIEVVYEKKSESEKNITI